MHAGFLKILTKNNTKLGFWLKFYLFINDKNLYIYLIKKIDII